MDDSQTGQGGLSRREWLKAGGAAMGLAAVGALQARAGAHEEGAVTFGLLTDVHYADRDPAGSRHYRDSRAKVRAAIDALNPHRPAFCVHLGDLVDKGETVEHEFAYLRAIEAEYARFRGPRHYVPGNHDVATFSRSQFTDHCGARPAPYSFDAGLFHFIVLDACYRQDGTEYSAGNFDWRDTAIPAAQRDWLAADLRAGARPALVFVHQRLDDEDGPHGVKNAPAVRAILEESGRVLAVLQGHDHAGATRRLNGIHYLTLKAVVEGPGRQNNAYALATVRADGALRVAGFERQDSGEYGA